MSLPSSSSCLWKVAVIGIIGVYGRPGVGDPPRPRDGETVDLPALMRECDSLRERGEYTKAVSAAKTAVARCEQAFGAHDRRTLSAKSGLAVAYLELDRKADAAPLLREVLAVLEQADPQDLSAIATAVGDLAQAVDKPVDAEPLYRRAVALAEKAHGPGHPATGQSLNNLGGFLYENQRYEEAEPVMRRALRIRERMEGMGSPLTAQSLCTLGLIAAKRGDLSVAESLVRGSLERRRAVLPKGHPDLAESCCELARILVVFGKDRAKEAAALASEALETYRKVFGPTHGRTVLAMHVKADALAELGRQTESELLHQDVIRQLEMAPSAQVDLLADGLREFGEHMLQAGKPVRTIELCQRAIALRQKAHGRDDKGSAAIRQVLAEAHYAAGHVDEAVREGREVLRRLESDGSEPTEDTAAASYLLAKYLLAAGGMEEARDLLRRSVATFEQTTGRGSRHSLRAIYLLAVTYVATDELGEAERLVDDGLRRFGDAGDVRTGAAAGELIGLRAVIYRKTGRIKEAEQAEAVAKQVEAEERR